MSHIFFLNKYLAYIQNVRKVIQIVKIFNKTKYFRLSHVVRSVSIFFEFPPCADYEKSYLLYVY